LGDCSLIYPNRRLYHQKVSGVFDKLFCSVFFLIGIRSD
jgi:hypothetical protein